MRRLSIAIGALLILGGQAAAADDRPGPGHAAEGSPWIVFSSNRAGPWRIWRIRPDGSGLGRLSNDGGQEHDVDPAFSPDGRSILFTSTRGGTTGIWKMPREGGTPERIGSGDQAEWSPDGKRIVFRRKEQILVRELATGVERPISPPPWPHCSGPAWSPDGKRIALACRWDAGNALFLLSIGGGEPITIYDRKPACEPHWSPDGARLVYETETNICTIGADGKKNRVVTYFGGVQRYGRFSPDGKSIVYCQGPSERGPWELFVIPAQGGTPRQLTEGASDMNPDWK
jgi:Tol biopolymer transport system component